MDIQELVRAQRAYFLSGATRSYAFRMEQLKKLQQALRSNEALLEQAMYQDFRKAPMEVYMCETGMVLEEVRFHLKHLKGWMRERTVPTPLAQFPSKSFVSPEPYGVALIISPWNYPVQLCLSPLVGAISGGNCAVVKPSAYAPATSAAIAKLIAENFDPRYIAAVEGGRAENSALLSQRFDTIFFTGSVAVGKVVMEAAAKHLTPVTLELGGKSPVIVDKTADVKLAARRIAFGKVLNAGQTCVEPDYLLIEKSVKPAFIEAYRQALHEFFPDGSMDEMPVIVSEKHFARVTKLLEGQNACIGGTFDEKTRFVAPTLLDGVSPDSPVMQEEIFGPILPTLPFDRLQEAIDFIRSEDPRTKYDLGDGHLVDYLPNNRFALPVNKDNAIASGIVKESDRDLMVDTIYLELPKRTIDKSEMMLLDMLAHFDWKRPIHFTQVYILQSLGLLNYLQFDGYSYRLVPIYTPNRSVHEIGRIDPDYITPLLTETFRYGNIADPRTYADYFIQYNLSASKARESFARAAKEYVFRGDSIQAIRLLDMGLEKLPPQQIRYTDANTFPFIEGYYMAGAPDKGDSLLMSYARNLMQYIDYYLDFQGIQGDMVTQTIIDKMQSLDRLYYLAAYMGRQDVLAQLNDYYRTLGIYENELIHPDLSTPSDSVQIPE